MKSNNGIKLKKNQKNPQKKEKSRIGAKNNQYCRGWEDLKKLDYFKQPVSLMLTRKIPGTHGFKYMRRLGSIYGGTITILLTVCMMVFLWMGINEMYNGKKDIYIKQKIQNMFKEPDNEV